MGKLCLYLLISKIELKAAILKRVQRIKNLTTNLEEKQIQEKREKRNIDVQTHGSVIFWKKIKIGTYLIINN